MKRFQMITEADARTLEYGSTVLLVAGGHVTPLAQDTLKERRVSLVREDGDGDVEGLAPKAEIRTVAIAGDHTAVALKKKILEHLRSRGVAVHDLGTNTSEPVDYPDTAASVAVQVARGEADAGIVIDGAGLGSTIAANKVDGIRAAMCLNQTLARYARQHNGANVLALGSTLVTPEEALTIVDTFIGTPMREPRYIRRLAKIRAIEARRV
jgi:ribose 5-phosphate isomerase B